MAKQKIVASAGSNITKTNPSVKETETLTGTVAAAPVTFFNIIVTIFEIINSVLMYMRVYAGPSATFC